MRTSIKKPVALISALLLAIFITAPVLAVAPAPGAFERTWARTDKPVADDVVDRTWIWGPEANTEVMEEPYAESPGGVRDVQYFDKSRMEINDPNQVDDGLWYVTNGLLVVELMSGMMQVGDDEFEERSPAEINIVGDPGYDETPTYADYAGLQDDPAHGDGSLITATVNGDGSIGTNEDLGEWNVTAEELAPLTGHRTASVFWEFMNSSGTVYEDGQFVADQMLFLNPYYATGYPITEAYWSLVMLAGSEQWVLTQAFERRVLTYAPNNNEGFQVEAGNVGLHYYEWRYETEPETGTINVTTFENDDTTVTGGVLVEAHMLDEGETCDDVTFGTDEPTATGSTNATTGTIGFADLDPGTYCVGADFDENDVADDDTALAVVTAGGSVAVSLSNPDDGVTAEVTVTVVGDDDMFVAGADVDLYAGSCEDLDGGETAVATGETNGSGVAVLNVDDLEAGDYCLVASDTGGVIGEVDITLPGDTDATIGGTIGVTVESNVGTNEVQTLSASGATAGTFTLTFDGQETAGIAWNASAAVIEAALEALSNVEVGDVSVTGGPINVASVTVTFEEGLGLENVPELEVDTSNLVEIAITTTTEAVLNVNEVQLLSSTDATSGTFTLTFDGQTTNALAFNASATAIQNALLALTNIGPSDVVVTGGDINASVVTITFGGDLAATNVDQVSVDDDALDGETVGIVASTSTEGAGANEVQTIAPTGATDGTFTLTYGVQATSALPYNASAAQIEAALEALLMVDDVEVSGGPVNNAAVTIEFAGEHAGEDVAQLTGDDSLLIGSTIIVTTTTQGASPITQIITVGSAVTGGTFTLTYEGDTTAAIDFDATEAELKAALEALSGITVSVSGDLGAGESSTITFINPSPPESLLVVDDTNIS